MTTGKKRGIGFVVLLLIAIASYLGWGISGDGLLVVYMDVGQGDATFIRAPGGQTALIDGGRGGVRMVEMLEELGVERLDLMIASHADFDHIGGLVRAAEQFTPRVFIDNSLPHSTQAYENLLLAIDQAGSEYLDPSHRRIRLGEVELEILPPPLQTSDQNSNSVGVILRYGNFRSFIPGDATHAQQDWWLEQHSDSLSPVTIYRAAHHGSSTGDDLAFLQRLEPDIIVVSVGANNPYGHPHAESMRNYQQSGARILRTDEVGHISVAVSASGYFGHRVETGVLGAEAQLDIAALARSLLAMLRD